VLVCGCGCGRWLIVVLVVLPSTTGLSKIVRTFAWFYFFCIYLGDNTELQRRMIKETPMKTMVERSTAPEQNRKSCYTNIWEVPRNAAVISDQDTRLWAIAYWEIFWDTLFTIVL